MKKIRIISRLDIKNDTVIKPIHYEALRIVGKPYELSEKYYLDGADELLYIDSVASLYDRDCQPEIIRRASKKCFIPITVGGGIRTLDDISKVLHSGADKVAINTSAVKNPKLLYEAERKFGSQCIVLYVQAKQLGNGKWEAYTECGRERTYKDVIEWTKEAIDIGVGEILMSSVDMDGTKQGFDLPLFEEVAEICPVPLIAAGGCGNVDNIAELLQNIRVEGVAIGSVLHYGVSTIKEIKEALSNKGFNIRL